MDLRAELSAFLISRRARLQPASVGVPDYGGRRRVPGLRREELAQLAGVSLTHYTRLEQGHGRNVSTEVVDAVARALRLDADEREHLTNLMHPPRAVPDPGEPTVRKDLLCLIDGMPDSPAFVHGRHGNILARNAPAGALLGAAGESWPHLVLVDGPLRSMLDDHDRELLARRHAAYLRLCLSRYPGDPALVALAGSLHAASAEFRRLWAEHEVADWSRVTCRLRHPVAGEIVVAVDVMRPSGEPGQWVVTFTTEPGSPSQAALRGLVG
ncbi:helix-turn-helix domain-containing protein [Virgisporangium aliadipatigenens]|uniref:helix-turn-helix domain-containing protein n=1 Tax=Virgisporangium aliadipatigenens TaxID=741659 RepID=UPI0019433A99|nr:helix-turn-helix transcriptional regulator [Virgisporangium aliadipatigenens]